MALPALQALDQALSGAVASVAPSVVHVARGRGGGSGIAWSTDLVISSSFHTPDRTQVGIGTKDYDLELRDAEVIGRDPGSDVALLRVADGGLTAARFRELEHLGVGSIALAIGRPGRTARASLRAIGVLGPDIRTARGKLERYVESDRQIPRGFAGGPLVDAAGQVIGMNTRTLIRGADLAVPTVTLRRVVAELETHGGVRRGYLGVGVYPVALSAALATKLGRERGALIASVEDGGPAATAGVLVGDIVFAIDGTAVDSPDGLRTVLDDRPGDAVTIDLIRGGVVERVAATLGSRP
ncbi:MAG: S1C family serine protease [Kofleriaceae bacterium]